MGVGMRLACFVTASPLVTCHFVQTDRLLDNILYVPKSGPAISLSWCSPRLSVFISGSN